MVMRVMFLAALAALAGSAQGGALKGQLDILTTETLSGNNPATGASWAPGDQYRFAFHTSAGTTATSTDIATYNAWVQSLADASTAYNIGADEGVSWKAIGSTGEVDARDNTSTNPTVETGHAIFLLDGSTIVANNYADLWDGEIQNIINLTEQGTEWAHWPFTGTYTDGTAAPGNPASFGALGDAGDIHQGQAGVTTNWIWRQWTGDPGTTELPMYALSDPLVVSLDDPNFPSVDAGEDMITWSGEPVRLDPNVVNNDAGIPQAPLTYSWSSADPGVVFDPPAANVRDPNVTIIKPGSVSSAVTVVNSGLEDPVLGDGGWTRTPVGWTEGYYYITDPGMWVADDSACGAYNPTVADGYGGAAPEGDNVMYTTAAIGYDNGMNQVLRATVQADTQYSLSVLVGNPFGFNGGTSTADYRIELLAGGVVLASDTGASPADDTTWKTASVTYDSGESPAQLGEALEIRLVAVSFTNGKGVDFDDVKLSAASPPPEPYTVTLILAVNNEGSARDDVKDSIRIDVYDDACKAARLGMGRADDNSGDFDGNCITNANDLAELVTRWLTPGGLQGPIPK